MKKIIAILVVSLIGAGLLSYIPVSFAEYKGQSYDAADEKYITKKIDQYKGKKEYYTYFVKVCAKDRPLAIAEVVLKSDTETFHTGNKSIIPKGQCTTYGSVMKAKNPNSLGADLIQVHEALEMIKNYKFSKNPNKSIEQDINRLHWKIGFMPIYK